MSNVKFDFRDKAVLVTGGTRGIGAATVRAFLGAMRPMGSASPTTMNTNTI